MTLLLFLAAFSIASRKIQKGKVQRNFSFAYECVSVCVLNLTSNSLEKTKQIKQIVCGGFVWVLGKARQTGHRCEDVWVRENVQHFGPGGNKENT